MPASPRPTSGPPPMVRAILLGLGTVVLLALSFAPFYMWPAVFVALVPLTVCVIGRPLKFRWLLFYYAVGYLFFAGNLFWMWPVTVGGTFALSLYIALYFVLYAFGVHRLVVDMRVPATVAVPVVWTACEFVRCVFLEGGFPWFALGNVFAANKTFLGGAAEVFLQFADVFGVWGLTFFATMINGFFVDMLRMPRKGTAGAGNATQVFRRLASAVAVFTLMVGGYGWWRLQEYPSATEKGPMVATIQGNVPQKVKDDEQQYEKNFREHLGLTVMAAEKFHPRLIAWPETMAAYPFNKTMRLWAENAVRLHGPGKPGEAMTLPEKILDTYKTLCATADRYGTRLLVGNSQWEFTGGIIADENKVDSNTAAYIVPKEGEIGRYAKVHLVPFGEYIPFAARGTALRKFLLNLTPLSFDYSLEPGKEWTKFLLPGEGERDTRFSTPICFEDAMPGPARAMARLENVGGAGKKKGVDFMVNISNDGWFYTAELHQHLQACQVRAVETRTPIVRSVNTGNSGFIDSCGRAVQILPPGVVDVAGWRVELDKRVPLYLRVGDLLPILCGIAGVLLVAWTFVRPRRKKKAA